MPLQFFRYVLLLIEGVIKFVMRRGKELVPTAVVSTGNDENEYGKVAVERTMPFTSSSSDVMQASIRCNTDYQYQKKRSARPFCYRASGGPGFERAGFRGPGKLSHVRVPPHRW